MEAEPAVKVQRRKLKRVVQKKKKTKLSLNSSASVAYYKKIKGTLNASLNNTSRICQTLKSNNIALAQSLQRVKQELRHALNENGCLKMENQDLNMRQAGYEQRLKGMKAVFNRMSRHLLDLGNCVSDGMDLCLVSPRPSETSTSHPQSMEVFRVAEREEERAAEALLTEPSALSMDCESYNVPGEWEGELYGEANSQGSLGKMVTPDMSIIMEQSIMLDQEEGLTPSDTYIDAVMEEPLDVSKPGPSSKNGSKKVSAITKLPQRIRNGSSLKRSSNEEGSSSPDTRQKLKNSRTSSGPQRAESKNSADKIVDGKCFTSKKSPSCPRRETFVVSRSVDRITDNTVETSSTGSVEDITSIPMPELVSASPMKDEQAPEVFAPEESDVPQSGAPQDVQTDNEPDDEPAQSPAEENRSQSKPAIKSKGTTIATSSKEKRKSAGKKTESITVKTSKGATNCRVAPSSQKDTEFFVSNPCALNLVHKRVTGSSEGCLAPSKADELPPPVSTVDQFMAHIKESNRKSKTLASFYGVYDTEPRRSFEKPANVDRAVVSSGPTLAPEVDKTDHTMYFDTDMELTVALPQLQNPVAVVEEQSRGDSTEKGKKETRVQPKTRKAVKEDNQVSSRKSKQRAVQSKVETADMDGEEANNEKVGAGMDKKLAVALRVNKPGQMVFAAARKEEDGSRKAIPAKMQTKARSKSKKQVEEMVKSLPQKEPECIFDFHDKTPRPTASEGKASQQQGSVFDLSLNDTLPGVTPTLASIREKLKVINSGLDSAETQEEKAKAGKDKTKSIGAGEAVYSGLLGDAPVYALPLKDGDDSSQPEPRPRSRGRSSTRSKEASRQRRSRSCKDDKEQDGENINPECHSRSSRSKSRGRTAAETSDFETDGEGVREKKKSSITGRNSEPAPNIDDDDYSNCEKPRRSARSRSRTHKRYTVDVPSDDELSSSLSNQQKKEVGGRSRSKVKKDDDDDDDDEEYKPSVRSQPRGRSRRRQADVEQPGVGDTEQEEKPVQQCRGRSRRRIADVEQPGASNTEQEEKPGQQRRGRSRSRRRVADVEQPSANDTEQEKKSVQQCRGRSRSRRRVEKDQSSINKDEYHVCSKVSISQDNVSEPKPNSTSIEASRTQQSLTSPTVSDRQQDNKGNGHKLKHDKEEAATDESEDSDKQPLKLVTDRKQRSKSRSKKIYSQFDTFSDPFGFSADVETNPDSEAAPLPEKKRHRTRSRDAGLVGHKDKEEQISKESSEDIPKGDASADCLPKSCPPKHLNEGSEKRKATTRQSQSPSAASCEQEGSPSKKLCTESRCESVKSQPACTEMSENVKANIVADKQEVASDKDSGSSVAVSSPLLKKKRKSILPVAVPQCHTGDEEDDAFESPALTKARSKTASKLPEPKSAVKNKYHLQFEELKQKLEVLDQADTSRDSDMRAQPVKKSRPLVLPDSSKTASPGVKKTATKSLPFSDGDQTKSKGLPHSKKGRSQPGSPKNREGVKLQPGSPVPRVTTSASSSIASSPRLSGSRSSLGPSGGTDESSQSDGRRGRRAAASVCYKEPSLNAKLRRGDPHTTFFHKEQMNQIYKSPKGHRKQGRLEGMDRGALHDLTNISIIEVDSE